MNSRVKNKSAYTLIEVLVATTISVIVFGVGFAGYREFSRRQELSGVKNSLISDLRLIQQLSLTGQKPSGSVCTKLNGHTFSITSSTSYELIANCTDGNVTIKDVDFSSYGVTVSAGASNTQFKSLGHGTDLAANNTITLTNSISGTTAQVTIGIGGDIK